MNRIVYLNGDWMPENEAKVSIFDRGYVFGDAIYEVTAVVGGKLVDYAGHAARLQRSIGEVGIVCPLNADDLLAVHREIVKRNALNEGLIYLQISRGAADRDFHYPENPKPTLSLFTQSKKVLDNPNYATGISVITVPDIRWGRRDIKTVQLLAPSMAKMEAQKHDADDAWLYEDGFITESTSSSAHIVNAQGTLITRQLSTRILHGITRRSILDLAREAGISVEERPFTVEEAKAAKEAFITSATQFAIPVVRIDGQPVGDGKPGPVGKKLHQLYLEHRVATAI
ncbi:D-amino-acid transaminase [Oleispirillum naphthae]|uniref:D-amino-acid transaminase n=1 Tax=Oleispirillum naphthae TaxID=2838853 RepID=UPI0030823884